MVFVKGTPQNSTWQDGNCTCKYFMRNGPILEIILGFLQEVTLKSPCLGMVLCVCDNISYGKLNMSRKNILTVNKGRCVLSG